MLIDRFQLYLFPMVFHIFYLHKSSITSGERYQRLVLQIFRAFFIVLWYIDIKAFHYNKKEGKMSAARKEEQNPDWLVKAYDNSEFLHSPAGRIIRVLSELTEPASRFRKHKVHNTVVFFGSARAFPLKTARENLKKIEKKVKNTKSPSRELKAQYQLAERDLAMSHYYDDAVVLSERLTLWFK